MRILPIVATLALAGCSAATTTANLSTPAGTLFCSFVTSDGGTITAAIIDAAASAVPGAGEVAVLATGAAQSVVDADCAAAAKAENATAGIPVSPPANPAAAPKVAVVVASAS